MTILMASASTDICRAAAAAAAAAAALAALDCSEDDIDPIAPSAPVRCWSAAISGLRYNNSQINAQY